LLEWSNQIDGDVDVAANGLGIGAGPVRLIDEIRAVWRSFSVRLIRVSLPSRN
jgi:hypothetical protein